MPTWRQVVPNGSNGDTNGVSQPWLQNRVQASVLRTRVGDFLWGIPIIFPEEFGIHVSIGSDAIACIKTDMVDRDRFNLYHETLHLAGFDSQEL